MMLLQEIFAPLDESPVDIKIFTSTIIKIANGFFIWGGGGGSVLINFGTTRGIILC